MKALSLKQPYAELVVSGKKTTELRKWKTNFRGEFLVRASKIPDVKAIKQYGFKEEDLPLGYIVGKSQVLDVKEYKNEKELLKDGKLHLASSKWGKYGFILGKSERLKPVSCNGSLNFWEFDK